MTSEARSALESALGAPPPDGVVAALEAGEAERLAEAIERARREQHEALADAVERALELVPLPLRGAVRRAAGL